MIINQDYIMQRVAFKMKLFKGCEVEYKKRHDELWKELKDVLKRHSIADYSIYVDEETNALFAYLTIKNAKDLKRLPGEPIMQKWWAYMKDLMETNEDGSPVIVELKEVFYLK